jgi:bacterioferritin-associated ferredoxin
MTPIEKAIREFCGHHADWWPSTTQVQEMLALAQPCPTCEALARTVMLDQTSYDPRPWVGLTDEEREDFLKKTDWQYDPESYAVVIEAKLKEKNT